MVIMMPYPVINLEETGRNIRNMIRERDITVAEISSFLGINRSSVYKVMRGEAVFSLDNMFALSMLLDTSVNDMIVAG
jgi:predicted XRE-type DNA-binding protein